MLICFCTQKTEEEVMQVIERLVPKDSEMNEELVKKVHTALNEEEVASGRCYGCMGDVEELVEVYLEKNKEK